MRGDDMKNIIKYLSKTPYFKEFMTKFKNNDEIQLTNTNDNISLLVLLYLFQNNDKNILVVTPNLYKAQKVYDELVNLVDNKLLSFFPQDEFVTTEMLAVSKEFKFERINTIKRTIENKKNLVVTNTAGLLKYELPKNKWEKAILSLSKGESINLETLPRRLVTYGYKRGLTVEKQGDFSLRGSILDIFPISESKPLRIDFFDDEIDSIRYFDINTQRSTVQTKTCVIYPVYEFFYTEDELEVIKKRVENIVNKNDLSEKTINRVKEDLLNLENRNDVDKLTRYLTFLDEKSETIVDFIDNQIYLDGENISEQIRTPEVTENVSTIASISQVREVLVDFQRRIAENRNIVMDGRDIGTKVIPNTKYKFFITASLEERARRRFVEMKTKGFDVELEEIKEAIDLRDKADSQREDSPLVMASDARLIDTTGKTINQVVDAVIEEINNL